MSSHISWKKIRVEEGISIEREHCTGKILKSDGTRSKKRAIVVKFLNFKDKSRVLHT